MLGASGASLIAPSILGAAGGGSVLSGINPSILGMLGMAGFSALSSGGDLLSAGLNYKYNKKLSKRQFGYQQALLKMQLNWAERMANTAHQREIADLRAAGLNPILSATGGNGAASPVTSAPGAPSGGNLGIDLSSALSDGFSSGLQMARFDAAVNQLKASTALERAKVDTERSQQHLNNQLAEQAAAQAKEINSGLPINRIPGSALNLILSDPFADFRERLGLLKDSFNLGVSEFRRYKQFYQYQNSAKRSRGTVTPIYHHVVNN